MSLDLSSKTWDVIVIGAGPAGALSALLAARTNATTLLVEQKKFPRPKVCGGCLNASAVELLNSLGLGSIATNFGLQIDRLCLGLQGKKVNLMDRQAESPSVAIAFGPGLTIEGALFEQS